MDRIPDNHPTVYVETYLGVSLLSGLSGERSKSGPIRLLPRDKAPRQNDVGYARLIG
jgi:hypothetical protein